MRRIALFGSSVVTSFMLSTAGDVQTTAERPHAATDAPTTAPAPVALKAVAGRILNAALRYDTIVRKTPRAALSIADADMIDRLSSRDEKVGIKLVMSAHTLPDAPSRNIAAELRGREKPDEVIVIGGHIDSWDVGQGRPVTLR